MVRAGKDNELAEQFDSQQLVAIGWPAIDDLSSSTSRDAVKDQYAEAYPAHSKHRRDTNAGQLWRFAHEITEDDYVLSYVKLNQEYLIGRVSGPYRYRPDALGSSYPHIRPIDRIARVPRDDFSAPAKRSMRSPLTVFSLDDYVGEIQSLVTVD